jgi:hypothetical protein
MSRVSNWWVGDWLQYGSARWGEKYVEAARITGYDVKTLRNIAYVARHFDLSRRRDTLTWSHHAEVAMLDPNEQDKWLDRAVADRLAVADLRIELRRTQRGDKAVTCDEKGERHRADEPSSSLVCPNCGEVVALDVGAATTQVGAKAMTVQLANRTKCRV